MKNPLKSSVAPKDFNVTVSVSPGKTMLLLVVNECLDGPTWKNKLNQPIVEAHYFDHLWADQK